MQRKPHTLDGRPTTDRPTRQRLTAADLAVVAVPVLLWAVANPLTALVVTAALATAVVAFRLALSRARRLAECVRECCCATVDVGGRVRITLSRPDAA